MQDKKFIYEALTNKIIEEKVVETKEENGEKIEISRNVKKLSPVKLSILKPNRRLFEGAEMYYAKQMSEFIKMGLLPYTLVAKRYANDGGALSETDKKDLETLQTEGEELEKQFFLISDETEEKKKQKNDLLVKINKNNTQISNIKNAYVDIFEHTAEVKARNKTIQWWVFHLSYIEENKIFVPLFGDGTLDEKLDKYDELSDKEDPFYDDCIKRLSYLVAFWFSAKTALSKVDFESMDKVYQENYSTYKPEEKVDNKVD